MRALALLPLALLALAACAGPRGASRSVPGAHDLKPGMLLTAEGEALSFVSFADAVAHARFVLVGESHDQACDHRVQAEIVRALADRSPAIGLEMVSRDRQPILDDFHRGAIDLDGLEEALSWGERWGAPFSIYEPIFRVARERGLPIVALNLPHEVVRRVGREGEAALPPEVPEPIPPPPEQEAMLRRAFRAHAHAEKDGEEGFARFVRVQSLWDTAMAQAALEASGAEGLPVVILAGAGHVTNGWGIAHRLARLAPDASSVAVMPWRGDRPLDSAQAPFFFYCPGSE